MAWQERTHNRGRERELVVSRPSPNESQVLLERELEKKERKCKIVGGTSESFTHSSIVEVINGAISTLYIMVAIVPLDLLTRQIKLPKRKGAMQILCWAFVCTDHYCSISYAGAFDGP
jgi:hypothetical protein